MIPLQDICLNTPLAPQRLNDINAYSQKVTSLARSKLTKQTPLGILMQKFIRFCALHAIFLLNPCYFVRLANSSDGGVCSAQNKSEGMQQDKTPFPKDVNTKDWKSNCLKLLIMKALKKFIRIYHWHRIETKFLI